MGMNIDTSRVFGTPECSNDAYGDGCYDAMDAYGTAEISFTSSYTLHALAENATYRFIADQDVYIHFLADGQTIDAGTPVFLPAEFPEVFRTNSQRHDISVVRKSADGTLWIVKMADTTGR